MEAVYVAPLLYVEEVVWLIKNLPDFSWLQSPIPGSKSLVNIMKKRGAQIVGSMSGVCKKVIWQRYRAEAEDELQVTQCLGFFTWAIYAQHSSVFDRHFCYRSCAILSSHAHLCAYLQPQYAFINRETRSYKSQSCNRLYLCTVDVQLERCF